MSDIPRYIVFVSAKEMVRLLPDGTTVVDWDVVRETAAAFYVKNAADQSAPYEIYEVMAAMLWGVAHPNVKP